MNISCTHNSTSLPCLWYILRAVIAFRWALSDWYNITDYCVSVYLRAHSPPPPFLVTQYIYYRIPSHLSTAKFKTYIHPGHGLVDIESTLWRSTEERKKTQRTTLKRLMMVVSWPRFLNCRFSALVSLTMNDDRSLSVSFSFMSRDEGKFEKF